jgi:hypothetical protein
MVSSAVNKNSTYSIMTYFVGALQSVQKTFHNKERCEMVFGNTVGRYCHMQLNISPGLILSYNLGRKKQL